MKRRTQLYPERFEQEFRERLAQGDVEALVVWIDDQMCQNYLRGIAHAEAESRGDLPDEVLNEDWCTKCGKSGSFPDCICETCYEARRGEPRKREIF